MGRVLRGALALLTVVVLVAVVAVGGLVAAISVGGQPQLSGTRDVPGLGAEVTVTRDENGVTQIGASSQHDLFFAQGWVHASERMWQMEIWRRAGAGRLSELFGETTVDQDRFVRTLGWRQAAERDLAVASPEGLAVLQAYADGVNAYLDGHPGGLGTAWSIIGAQSGKSGLFDGFRPEPWTPLDTLTWAKVQAWGLGGNWDTELFRLLMDAKLGDPAITDELFPAYSADAPVIAVPDGGTAGSIPTTGADALTLAAESSPDAAAWLAIARAASSIPEIVGLAPARDLVNDGGVGSNNWVVAPSRTATGTALLANDPHLGFNMPSVWYVNGLHCQPVSTACPYDVAGVTFPGTPGVVAGHNANIAWGVTNVNPDVQDLVEEKLDPADSTKYLTATGSAPFVIRVETIKVAGGEDVVMEVRETSHGPILNGVEPSLADGHPMYALRWTALQAPDQVLEAFLGVDRATDFTAFREALSLFGAPSQNFVYADRSGNIGYQMPGKVPVRTLADDHGLRPVPGWDGQHEWASYIPFDKLPSVYNPTSGRIVTANNAVFDGTSGFLGAEYDRGDRAARIAELIDAAGNQVTLDTFAAIQGDTLLRRAARMTPGLVDLAPKPGTPDGAVVLDLITRWDGRCDTASAGCAAYMTFEYAIERAVFDDELGDQARSYIGSDWANDLVATLVGTDAGRASTWWGNRTAGTGASAADVTALALDAAGSWLRRDMGDPDQWTWGRIHHVAFKEATLGISGIGPLEWIFGTSPAEVNGAAGAVDNTYSRLGRGYQDPADPTAPYADTLAKLFSVTNGPSMRALYDMGNLDAGRIVTTTGQSGQPFSSHADDWVGKWLRNETVPLPFTREAIDAAAAAVLVLRPAP